jgi:hypothetical protein
MNRISNLERSVRTGGTSRRLRGAAAKSASSSSSLSRAASGASPGRGPRPHVVFAAAFDDGRPIVVRGSVAASRRSLASSVRPPSRAGGDWRSVGTLSEAGYDEPIDGYEDESSTQDPELLDAAPVEAVSAEPVHDAQDTRAFAAEVERLLSQAQGTSAPEPSRASQPSPPRPQKQPPPPLADEHPHSLFDRMNMSMASAFDAGTLDLDGVERDALPRKTKPRFESFSAAAALPGLEIAEDLALLRAQSAPDAGTAPVRHYDIASGVTLAPAIEKRLAPIADAYFAKTNRNIYVTSGTRSVESQARAMYDKLQAGGDFSDYRNKTAAAEIKKAHDDAAGKAEAEIVRAMADVIQKQVDKGVYISLHLLAGAVDVRKKDMNDDERKAFEAAVKAQSGVSLLDEGEPPHFQLEFR